MKQDLLFLESSLRGVTGYERIKALATAPTTSSEVIDAVKFVSNNANLSNQQAAMVDSFLSKYTSRPLTEDLKRSGSIIEKHTPSRLSKDGGKTDGLILS